MNAARKNQPAGRPKPPGVTRTERNRMKQTIRELFKITGPDPGKEEFILMANRLGNEELRRVLMDTLSYVEDDNISRYLDLTREQP